MLALKVMVAIAGVSSVCGSSDGIDVDAMTLSQQEKMLEEKIAFHLVQVMS